MEDLRYPVGPFEASSEFTPEARNRRIEAIEALPDRLEEAISGLDDGRLDTVYRPGGWTVRQLVHHIADSHMNAVIRFRLALTEDVPTIKPYEQSDWAELSDAAAASPEPSIEILRGLHARWTSLLRSLPPDSFRRTLHHPEIGNVTVDWLLDQYAWHCRHHVAHITALRTRNGW